MPESRHGRIVVDVELDDRHGLLGTVALEGGATAPFHGWIGLFSVLEGTLGLVRDGAPGSPGDGRSPAGGT